MKVTVDIDPTNVGSVFGSVKKALSNCFDVAEAKEGNASSNLFHAMDILSSLESLYSVENSVEFYHYLGKFIETMEGRTRSLVPEFGTDPEKNIFKVIAENQYKHIITKSFSNIAELAYMCADGIYLTENHEKKFKKSSQVENASEHLHKIECTEKEHATINDTHPDKKDEEEDIKWGDFYDLAVDEEEDGTHVYFKFNKEKYDKYWTQFKAREKKYGWDKAKLIIRGF